MTWSWPPTFGWNAKRRANSQTEQARPRPNWRPGHVGPIPYLLILRLLVLAGVLLRFYLHDGLETHPLGFGLALGTFVVATIVAGLHSGREELTKVRLVWGFIVALDIAVVSAFYWLTGNPQSDFFLFYYLPLFTAAEYLGGREQIGGRYVVATFIASTCSFLAVILTITPAEDQGLRHLLARVFLPREVFFLAVSAILALRLHREVAAASERTRLFNALHEVGAAAPGVVALHQELESMLDHVVNVLGFEYATISLVDRYARRIVAVRGRNVPPGWLTRSVHSLEGNDIQACVVRTRETVVSDKWDSRFNKEIWTRYKHQTLARVFAPIISAKHGVIGTVEAGASHDKRHEVRAKSAAVTALGEAKGEGIARVLPHVLLELVASHAMMLIGAHSASLHVFDGKQPLLAAGAGKADPDFLADHPPSEGGIGQEAMRTGHYQICDELPTSKEKLRKAGIRSIAAFPLSLGDNISGVLYLHYWDKPHTFTLAEVELVQVFVPQMEVAIHNHLIFKQISRSAEGVATVTGLQNVIRALSERASADHVTDLEQLFGELAENILHMLDARNVTLYEYRADERKFGARAVVRGVFKDEAAMTEAVRAGDVVHQVVRDGASLFIADLEKDADAEFLSGPRQDGIERERFTEREGNKSCIVLVLRSPYDNEVVGCLFANYAKPNFDANDSKAFRALAGSLAAAVAVAIKTRRLYAQELSQRTRDAERTRRELDALHAVDRAIVTSASNPSLEAIYEVLLEQALSTLKADAGDVTIWEPERKRLRIVTAQGYPEGNSERSLSERVRLGCGIVGWVARHRQPFRSGNVLELTPHEPGGPAATGLLPTYGKVDPNTRSELAVPVLDGSTLVGVINLEQHNANAFTDRDEQFLQTLAVQGAIAIHSIRQYARFQKQLGQALVLGRIGDRLSRAGSHDAYEMDALLRLILTGMTAGQGLGFSRAMVFIAAGAELRGRMGVGSLTQREADETWEALEVQADKYSGSNEDFLQWQLNEAELTASRVGAYPEGDSALSLATQKLSLPIDLSGVVAECFVRKSCCILQGRESDPLRHHLGPLYEGGADCALACVPILLGEERVGLIVLDRRFIFDQEVVDVDCAPMLDAFARSATMSLQSLRLRDQLYTHQQLANWQRAAGDVAHLLVNRLSRIENEVSNVEQLLLRRQSREARTALATRVKRSLFSAERVISTMTRLDQHVKTETQSISDLRIVLDLLASENPDCSLDCPHPSVFAVGTTDKISDIFSELVSNARRALQRSETPEPRILIAVEQRSAGVHVRISDNGPGIAPEQVGKLFERGNSGSHSTGLGLAIVRHMAREQGGEITYEPALPTGACFTVVLRLVEHQLGVA
jgi:GAF domain-containing protein/signal transduction histidine kinase